MSSIFDLDKYPALKKALENRQEQLEMLFRVCNQEQLVRFEGYAKNNPDMLDYALAPIWRTLAETKQG